MNHVSTSTTLRCASGVSAHVDAVMAAEQVCEEALEGLGEQRADLAALFVAGDHAERVEHIAEVVRTALGPGTLVGVTGEGVVGRRREVQNASAVSLFAASLPGTRLRAFRYQDLPFAEPDDTDRLAEVAEAMGGASDLRAVVLLADPFSVPAAAAVQTISGAALGIEGVRRCPVVGGLASASGKPGGNSLVLNDRVMRSGGVGLTISGDVDVDALVSQGCRPIGAPAVITAGRRNVIERLAGRRALDVVRETVDGLDEETRRRLTGGLFIGRVVNEYKERFGRGDFLVRGVMGVDKTSGAIAIGDSVRVGQTVQLHLRDAETAEEDLGLLLAAQQLRTPPAGALLFTCNARGSHLFDRPDHDASAVADALADDEGRPMPLAGFFAAGEIGPIGPTSYVHGHTASAAIFRPGPPAPPLADA